MIVGRATPLGGTKGEPSVGRLPRVYHWAEAAGSEEVAAITPECYEGHEASPTRECYEGHKE